MWTTTSAISLYLHRSLHIFPIHFHLNCGKSYGCSQVCEWASEIIAKYEKRGNYLPILHKATCNNYFIVKCLLKSNVSRVVLLTNCIELAQYNLMLIWNTKTETKTATTYLIWLYFVFPNSFVFSYFDLSILYSVHLFGI